MRLFTKLLLPLVLIIVFFVMFITLGFTGTSTNPTSTNPQGIQKEKPKPVIDPVVTYKKVCGECHTSYPPEFLPSGSWEKLVGSTGKHFETSVDVDNKTKAIIAPYLKVKGAEFSKEKVPQKIMQSLEGNTPLRITEVPYIVKKHRKIAPKDFQRSPIGSFANCSACHLLADDWIFNRKIVIPEYKGTSSMEY